VRIDELIKDFPEQFKNKKFIDVLLKAFDKQYQRILGVFQDLIDKVDVDVAEGAQLDGIGDIVGLSRTEARNSSPLYSSTPYLDDETYRKLLKHQIQRNYSTCTYDDIANSIKTFIPDQVVKYKEDPDKPATICMEFDAEQNIGEELLGFPIIKAAGVGVHIRMNKRDDFGIFVGFALQQSSTCFFECGVPSLDPHKYLVDEEDYILVDEIGSWLADEKADINGTEIEEEATE